MRLGLSVLGPGMYSIGGATHTGSLPPPAPDYVNAIGIVRSGTREKVSRLGISSFVFWSSPRGAGVACSLYGPREALSESRFRAVQFYDDPTNDCGSGSDTP